MPRWGWCQLCPVGSSASIPGWGCRAVTMAAAAHPCILAAASLPQPPAAAAQGWAHPSPALWEVSNHPQHKSPFKANQRSISAGMCFQWKSRLFQPGDTPVIILPLNSHHCVYPKALPRKAAHGISSWSLINMEYSFKSAFFLQFLSPSTQHITR